jgi:hypothetical protein
MDHPQTSSTSSFNVLKPSLCVGFVIVALYGVAVALGKVPRGEGITQDQRNWNKLLYYRFGPAEQLDITLAGSSMTAVIKPQLMDKRIQNLGVLGGSAATCLDVIVKSKKLPKMVIVELSHPTMRASDQKLLAKLDSSWTNFVSTNVKCLRAEYQPITVLLGKFKKPTLETGSSDKGEATKVSTAAFVRQLSGNLTTEESKGLDDAMASIKKNVAFLKDKGVNVKFMILPASDAVEEASKVKYARERFAKEFPGTTYDIWEPLEGKKIVTTDGIHIVPDLANDVARQILAFLEN